MKKLALFIFFGFAGISLLALLSGKSIFAPWSSVKETKQAKGEYFRFIGEFTYKGEPVMLDSVSACGARITVYKDNDRSEDIFSGPQLYGVKLPDGKALVAKAAFCGDHWRQDAGMPPDFMPLVVVYDDAETLASGYAYVSDEAYERPNSDLKLIRARIMPVTPDEAVALLKVQKPNVVRSLNVQSPWAAKDGKKLTPGKRPAIGVYCRGFMRLPVPSDVVDEMRRRWPEGHPRYWVPREEGDNAGSQKEYEALAERFRFSHLYGGPTVRDGIQVRGRDISDYFLRGVPTRTDGGSAGDNWDHGQGFENSPRRRNLRIAPPFYPLMRVGDRPGETVKPEDLGDFHFKVETQDDAKRGLLYCNFESADIPRQQDDKSACDIRFGDGPEVMNLPAPPRRCLVFPGLPIVLPALHNASTSTRTMSLSGCTSRKPWPAI